MGVMVNCAMCRKDFEKAKNKIKLYKTHYCSRKCHQEHRYILGHKTMPCTNCGKIFTRKTSTVERDVTRFCSSKCSASYTNSHNPKAGEITEDSSVLDIINKFGYKTRKQISEYLHILTRKMFKHLRNLPCVICGYDKVVELAHLKPVSSFPDTATIKEINGVDNVCQLCPNHHKELDKGIINVEYVKEWRARADLNSRLFT